MAPFPETALRTCPGYRPAGVGEPVVRRGCPGAKGTIDMNLPLAENLHNIARALNKPLSELTVTI